VARPVGSSREARRRSSPLAGRSCPRVASPKRPPAVAVLAQVHCPLRPSLSSATLPPANGKLAALGKETVKYPSPPVLAEPEMARANLGNFNSRSCRSCLVMLGHAWSCSPAIVLPWGAPRSLALSNGPRLTVGAGHGGQVQAGSGTFRWVGGCESASNDCDWVHAALRNSRALQIHNAHPFQEYYTSGGGTVSKLRRQRLSD
jgi:hypothetical protein